MSKPTQEEVLSAFRDAEWCRSDWQGTCPFRRHKDIYCMGTDGRVAPVGTPKPVPHSEGCPYRLLAALDQT